MNPAMATVSTPVVLEGGDDLVGVGGRSKPGPKSRCTSTAGHAARLGHVQGPARPVGDDDQRAEPGGEDGLEDRAAPRRQHRQTGMRRPHPRHAGGGPRYGARGTCLGPPSAPTEADGSDISVADIIMVIGGAITFLFSFFDFCGDGGVSISAWGDGTFPLASDPGRSSGLAMVVRRAARAGGDASSPSRSSRFDLAPDLASPGASSAADDHAGLPGHGQGRARSLKCRRRIAHLPRLASRWADRDGHGHASAEGRATSSADPRADARRGDSHRCRRPAAPAPASAAAADPRTHGLTTPARVRRWRRSRPSARRPRWG